MAILITKPTNCLVQGLTGKEGQRAASWMAASGTKIVAGVTPGKGGQTVENIPIYDTVAEALSAHPEISATSIYAPAKFALAAGLEAVDAGVPLIHLIAENMPVRDTAVLVARAAKAGVRLVGPSSIGLISPGIGKLGSIGGVDNKQFIPGPVGLLSKSGGMSSEIATQLTKAGLGQSTVVGIGGDRLIGSTFADLLPLFEADEQTKVVVMIGEIGGTYEEQAAAVVQKMNKPVVAFISGLFAETLPQGVAFGHAGAIVDSTIGTRVSKISALQQANAHIVNSPEDIVATVSKLLEGNR